VPPDEMRTKVVFNLPYAIAGGKSTVHIGREPLIARYWLCHIAYIVHTVSEACCLLLCTKVASRACKQMHPLIR
jgi:hypothetical protein